MVASHHGITDLVGYLNKCMSQLGICIVCRRLPIRLKTTASTTHAKHSEADHQSKARIAKQRRATEKRDCNRQQASNNQAATRAYPY